MHEKTPSYKYYKIHIALYTWGQETSQITHLTGSHGDFVFILWCVENIETRSIFIGTSKIPYSALLAFFLGRCLSFATKWVHYVNEIF